MLENNSKIQDDYYEISSGFILKRNIISYFLFFASLLTIDLTFLLYYQKAYYYIIPKLAISFVIVVVLIVKRHNLKYHTLCYLLLLTKILSIILTFIGGESYFQIFLLIVEEQEVITRPWQNVVSKIISKLGFLILMIVKMNILNICIGISLLAIEISKFLLQQKQSKLQENKQQQVVQQYHHDTICSKENNSMIRKMSNLQLCYLKISKKQQKITFKNENFSKHFCQIKTEEELNQLIIEKFIFQIVPQNHDQEEVNPETDFNNSRMKRHLLNQEYSMKHDISYDFQKLNSNNGTNLKNFLQNYEQLKLNNRNLNPLQIFQFYSEFQWSDEKMTSYSGEIIILDEEDEVVLKLIDITKSNKYQEKKIKEQFKATIVQSFSHELRTPLNSSLNFLQCCENDKSLAEEIRKNFISPAINALRLQSYLINDIIDFSSLCSDNLELDIQSVTVQQIVDEMSKLFKSALSMKNLALFVDLTKNEMNSIGTDYSRLMQILSNILQNSIKYSSQGAIILKITSPSIYYMKISIKDEGFGIDEQTLQQIHQLFQNVEDQKNFSEFETWHGFGLLISSMLLLRLRPDGQKLLHLKSEGRLKGTKVTFFLRNYIITNQLSSLFKEQSKKTQSSRFAVSYKSGSKNVSMNGSLVQLSDPDHAYSSNKANLEMIFTKKSTNKNTIMKSQENSSKSNSFTDVNFELKIGEFNNLHPFVYDCYNQSQREMKQESQQNAIGKIIQYEKIKNKEDKENEMWLKIFLQQRNCNCNSILSVDDEIFNQKSIQFLLKQKGIEVTLAYNGQQALTIIQEKQKCCSKCGLFLLILMDYQMPVMNGLEVTLKLRQMMDKGLIPCITIIGLTAFNSKHDIEQCLNAGMNAVLTKPLILTELFQILKQI